MSGDPTDDLRNLLDATRRDAAVLARHDRVFLGVSGRAPTQMLSGLLAGSMPPDPVDRGGVWRQGAAPCSAMLTPKGRMVTDMRVHRLAPEPAGALLLDLPEVGAGAATEHFGRYLPPRMARTEPVQDALASISVVGPAAARLLSGALAESPSPISPSELAEDEELFRADDGGVGLRIVRSGELGDEGYDVLGEAEAIEHLTEALAHAGAARGSRALRHLLRIERGRPAFGIEMDDDTMPAEAGILDRCVDTSKGCFTGQEVVVRIRDRGHVNRSLRGLLLERPVDTVPTTLYSPDDDRPVGELRSVAQHPVLSQQVGLGFVRRELAPPCTVRVGSPDGPNAHVRLLDRDGWRFEKGDPSFYP